MTDLGHHAKHPFDPLGRSEASGVPWNSIQNLLNKFNVMKRLRPYRTAQLETQREEQRNQNKDKRDIQYQLINKRRYW